MKVLYESLKRNLSNPLFYFVSIGAGFAFTLIFALFKPVRAVEISVIVFFSVILFSFLVAFILKNKQDVIEAAKLYESKGNHVLALKILMSAREKAHVEEDCLRLDYEIGSIYYSMKQYQQSVNIILETLKGDETEWTWKAYFLLAKASSYTKGFLSDETLDAYLRCIDCRKKFDAYGKADLNVDIDLCQRISEIYIATDNLAASNMWFRDEMILREAGCDIATKNKITDLQKKAAVLACENHTEDALRLYEEAAHLIGQHISTRCDKYAVVQLEMGRLFWKGFVVPRYDLALACFQKSVEIKRKYMSDISEELSASFACALPDMREVCKQSLDDNTELIMNSITKPVLSMKKICLIFGF